MSDNRKNTMLSMASNYFIKNRDYNYAIWHYEVPDYTHAGYARPEISYKCLKCKLFV